MAYEVIEEAVRQRLIAYIPGLSDSLCVAGDLDGLFEAMSTQGSNIGALLEYDSGVRLMDAPFNGKGWGWTINGYILLRYEGDNKAIEAKARDTVGLLFTLLDGVQTLGGVSALATIKKIESPEPARINDVPFYWVPFLVSALERI
jgi:hypothetical protein